MTEQQNNIMSNVANTINPVLHDGGYIKVLRAGNSDSELGQLAEFMEKYSEQGFRVVQSFYSPAGGHISEGVLTVIMEYDQSYMESCNTIAQKEGH